MPHEDLVGAAALGALVVWGVFFDDSDEKRSAELTTIRGGDTAGELPHVVGLRLSDAVVTLFGAGFDNVETFDASKQLGVGDGGRDVWNKSNWTVVSQVPGTRGSYPFASPVTLEVVKNDEVDQIGDAADSDDNEREFLALLDGNDSVASTSDSELIAAGYDSCEVSELYDTYNELNGSLDEVGASEALKSVTLAAAVTICL